MRIQLARRGFTLIELMLVVAIISLLAAIAIPKFSDLILKAREAAVRGALGQIRSVFSIFLADNEGNLPHRDQALAPTNVELWLVPKYIDKIPSATLPHFPHHGRGNTTVVIFGVEPQCALWHLTNPPHFSPWYIESRYGPDPDGTLFNYWVPIVHLNCAHPDSSGKTWSLW